jgi:hypothetical protein
MGEILLGVGHADFSHYGFRGFVDYGGKRHHLVQPELTEGLGQGSFRRLAGIASTPMSLCQTPTNFHTGGTRQIISGYVQPHKADKGSLPGHFYRPKTPSPLLY